MKGNDFVDLSAHCWFLIEEMSELCRATDFSDWLTGTVSGTRWDVSNEEAVNPEMF